MLSGRMTRRNRDHVEGNKRTHDSHVARTSRHCLVFPTDSANRIYLEPSIVIDYTYKVAYSDLCPAEPNGARSLYSTLFIL